MVSDNPVVDALMPPDYQSLVVQVGSHRLAFPTTYVAGVLLLERSQILALPFYHPAILGVVHDQGQLLPLVDLQQLLEGQPAQLREVFSAVQLREQNGLGGVGLAVNQIFGNLSDEAIMADSTIEKFQPQLLDHQLYQLQRWRKLTV